MKTIVRNIEDREAGILIEDGSVIGSTHGEVYKLDTLKNVVRIGDRYSIFFNDGESVFCVTTDMAFPYQWIKSDNPKGIVENTEMRPVDFIRINYDDVKGCDN